MPPMKRRDFLQYAAGALSAAAIMNTAGAAPSPRAVATRTLGKTGLRCSYLGAGTGIRGSGPGITELTLKLNGEQFVSLLEHAYARGITYFDMADRYGSHHYMRLAMKRSIPRDKVMLLSKVWSRDAETVKHDLERMREELDTDCIDIVLMHCLRKGEENWPETLKPIMDVLEDAKAKGHIKAHGVSCHILPALERAADEPWCDAVLARINPFGINMDGPVDAVVPILQRIHNAGKAVIGMKVLGEGHEEAVRRMDESFAFVTGLDCIDAVTIGFMSPAQLDEVMARMK